MFENKTIGIVTKHNKELLIGPLFEKELACKIELIPGIDTDLLGTFNGEIERELSPIETIQRKCTLGHEKGYDLVLASEGSFGFHPSSPFFTVNEELILLSDQNHNVLFLDRAISSENNATYENISSLEELEKCCEKIGFPSHGVILEFKKEDKKIFSKELTNFEEIIQVYETNSKEGFSCFIHSDLRAHRNPTRRKVIHSATQNLIQQLKSLCPKCDFPGFTKSNHEAGLPCYNCLKPTKSIRKTFIQCKKCTYYETVEYPENKFFEDPQFCDYCNP